MAMAARADHALEALEALLPDRVTVRRADGDVVIGLEDLRVEDVLLVRPGERVAADGLVLGRRRGQPGGDHG